MAFISKIEARQLVGTLSLIFAFTALLWAPFEWITALMTDAPNWAAANVAEKTKFLWPVSVGAGLTGGYLGYNARSWVAGFLVPFGVLTVLIFILTWIAYFYSVIVFLVFSNWYLGWLPFIGGFWVAYRVARMIIEKFFRFGINWQGNFANKSALFAITTIPQVLCLFGLCINVEWYFDFI